MQIKDLSEIHEQIANMFPRPKTRNDWDQYRLSPQRQTQTWIYPWRKRHRQRYGLYGLLGDQRTEGTTGTNIAF